MITIYSDQDKPSFFQNQRVIDGVFLHLGSNSCSKVYCSSQTADNVSGCQRLPHSMIWKNKKILIKTSLINPLNGSTLPLTSLPLRGYHNVTWSGCHMYVHTMSIEQWTFPQTLNLGRKCCCYAQTGRNWINKLKRYKLTIVLKNSNIGLESVTSYW